LAGTFVLHCCCGLNPRVNALFNLGLFVLWFVGLGLLTWWSNRPTLSHKCNAQNWGGDDGIMICRIYKVLFAFSLTGTYVSLPLPHQNLETIRLLTSLLPQQRLHISRPRPRHLYLQESNTARRVQPDAKH
jgi:hypothetical protein